MASISSHKISTGETRWRARVRLRENDITRTFHRQRMAIIWSRNLEQELLYLYESDPEGKYKLVRIS
jgi:hypothetical protein